MSNRDLDKSGFGFQRVRAYLGPSLGWIDEFVQPSTKVITGPGYEVQPGDSLILVDATTNVSVILPDVRKWIQQTATQPATAFDRSIIVKDFGGNGFSIGINAFEGQKIDKTLDFVIIDTVGGVVCLVPLIDLSGWTIESSFGLVGQGGAPTNAEYITASPSPTLNAERVLTNTATVTWDFLTPGQAKANAAGGGGGGGNVNNVGTPVAGQWARWTTAFNIEGVPAAQLREKLTSGRNYFVSPTGSDSNNGLTAGAPFQTLQHTWDVISALDIPGFTVDVQMADGTYTGGVLITSWFSGGGKVLFHGNQATPANVKHTVTNAICWEVRSAGAGILAFKDFRTETISAVVGDHFQVIAPLTMEYSNMEFGPASNGCHIRAFHPGFKITALNPGYKITGGAQAHWLLYYGVLEQGSNTFNIDVIGTPTFSFAFLYIDNNAKVNWVGTITGAAIGQRFTQLALTEIQTAGRGPDFFPGSGPGITLPGGNSVYL